MLRPSSLRRPGLVRHQFDPVLLEGGGCVDREGNRCFLPFCWTKSGWLV
jgi:hypothetical protein